MALHNGDGRTLWSRAFPAASAPSRLLPWRTYHDVTHAGEVLLLHEGAGGDAGTATVVNAHTGQQVGLVQRPVRTCVSPHYSNLHRGPCANAVLECIHAHWHRPSVLVHLAAPRP